MTPVQKICALSVILATLAACGGNESDTVYPDDDYVIRRAG